LQGQGRRPRQQDHAHVRTQHGQRATQADKVAYTVGRKRMAGPLELLRTWLTAHGVTIMATLLLVIGAVLIGQGLGGMV
jgi:hypothetical protein